MRSNTDLAAASLPAFTLSFKNGDYERGTLMSATELGAQRAARHVRALEHLPTMIIDESHEADVSLDAADPEDGQFSNEAQIATPLGVVSTGEGWAQQWPYLSQNYRTLSRKIQCARRHRVRTLICWTLSIPQGHFDFRVKMLLCPALFTWLNSRSTATRCRTL